MRQKNRGTLARSDSNPCGTMTVVATPRSRITIDKGRSSLTVRPSSNRVNTTSGLVILPFEFALKHH